MKTGVTGQSRQERSLPFNAERNMNFFTVTDESGKESTSNYGTPGLGLFSDYGVGPVRNCFYSSTGRAFFISGGILYESFSSGSAVSRGTLQNSSGNLTIDENPFQLGICDGNFVYMFTYATNTFVKVTDPDLPAAGSICFLDGYFIINKVGTGQFYISALNDGTSWDALDFATAESSPDALYRVISAVGQLWLLGTETGEIWTNTGDSAFPFERISGAKMEMGIASPYTAVAVDNSLFWLGQDRRGRGVVYRARGFQPQRISTNAIEYALQKVADLSQITAYTYQQDGHVFYVLTGGGLETTLVYDISTQLWHERGFLESNGTYGLHLGACCMFAFGKILLGSRLDGKLYEMSFDYKDDDGTPIRRERIFTHISDEGKNLRYSSLDVGFEVGVGTQTGQGYDPQAYLYISKDGGRTWSDGYPRPIGKVGKYNTKVCWRRIAVDRQMTFKLVVSDPVWCAITGAYLNV